MASRTQLAQPPAPLAAAIQQAARTYYPGDPGTFARALSGIWREESGGSYPNRYVNSSGYGGLFGTKDWNGPPLEQADLAASVLATGLQKSGGNWGGALSYYNSGRISGGYTSVPGFDPGKDAPVFGHSPAGIPTAPAVVPGAPGVANAPRPGVDPSSGGSGFWGGLEHAAEGAAGAVAGGIAAEPGLSIFSRVIDGAEQAINGPTSFLKAAVWLLNPLSWLRAVETIVGVGLIVVGVVLAAGVDKAAAADIAGREGA